MIMTTVVSDFHAFVIKWLENNGVELLEEVDFPPYRVDVYLPDYHAVIEVDGPHHTEKKDSKRDKELGDKYQLFVCHVTKQMFKFSNEKATLAMIQSFLNLAALSRDKRLSEVEDRFPWL